VLTPALAAFAMHQLARRRCRAWHGALVALSAALAVGVAATDSEDWDGDDADDGDGAARRVTAPFEVDGEVRHDWGQSNLRAWDGAVCPARSGVQQGNWAPAPPPPPLQRAPVQSAAAL